ncbi:Uncharacterised protein [Mycobacteroides abscessus subsp. abscessus]|nr:Uncharacterised protein [Mycobacteroides abscessus subsp. abscessus]
MNALRREAAASTCNRTGSPAPVEGLAEPPPDPVRVPQPDTINEPARSVAARTFHALLVRTFLVLPVTATTLAAAEAIRGGQGYCYRPVILGVKPVRPGRQIRGMRSGLCHDQADQAWLQVQIGKACKKVRKVPPWTYW